MFKQIIKYVVNEPEVIKPPSMLYEFTFPDLLVATKPVVDEKGYLWAGKDKKTELSSASGRISLWKAWQQSFKTMNPIPQPAMDYFQLTKHLSRPPKEGDTTLLDKKPIAPVVVPDAPRFTWSPSKLSDFEICPYMFAAKHYYKTIPYQETEATIWGTRVHAAAEKFFRDGTVEDEAGFAPVEKWCKVLSKVKGERFIEHKMSVDNKFHHAEWSEAEGRMILDFGVLKEGGEELLLVDFKTGRVKDDHSQLRLYSLVMALQHPTAQKITYKYVWVKEGITTGGDILRRELVPVAKEVKAKVEAVRTAWDNENFPQRRNGLCRSWCGAVECPHCGR